jgi:hypothetical protein
MVEAEAEEQAPEVHLQLLTKAIIVIVTVRVTIVQNLNTTTPILNMEIVDLIVVEEEDMLLPLPQHLRLHTDLRLKVHLLEMVAAGITVKVALNLAIDHLDIIQ